LGFIRSLLSDILMNSEFENATFFTGGCVRNHFLNRDISDVDICVNLPEGDKKLAEYLFQRGLGTKPVIYKNTQTVKISFQGITLEISSAYNAAGNSSYPTSLEEDALRRDFTINSLYLSVNTGDIFDFTGTGLRDLREGLIRAVRSPVQVFADDPLRILRGIRFAAEYGLRIEDNTWQAIQLHNESLLQIARERTKKEFILMLYGPDPARAINLLASSGTLEIVSPGTMYITKGKDALSFSGIHTVELLKTCQPDPLARWLCYLKEYVRSTYGLSSSMDFDSQTDNMQQWLKNMLNTFFLPSQLIKKLLSVLSVYALMNLKQTESLDISDKEIRTAVYNLRISFPLLMQLLKHDIQVMPEKARKIENLLSRMEKIHQVMDSHSFPLNGRIIISALGVSPGPSLGRLLEKAKNYWLEEPSLSKEALLHRLVYDNPKKAE